MIPGIDLAKYAHGDAGEAINYERAHEAGIAFAIIEYGDEIGALNPFFEKDHEGFKAAGVATGSYVYLRPELELAPQAAVLRSLGQYGPVWGDFEYSAGKTPAELRSWWGELLEAAPEIGLYTSESWLDSEVASTALTSKLWVAWWSTHVPGSPAKLWQSTADATVPGIPASVDIDHFLGTVGELETMFGQTPKPRATMPAPTVAAAAVTPSGDGYWLATPQGDVWTFGDALYHGSPKDPFPGDLVAILPTPSRLGYRLITKTGYVAEFGDARPAPLKRR